MYHYFTDRKKVNFFKPKLTQVSLITYSAVAIDFLMLLGNSTGIWTFLNKRLAIEIWVRLMQRFQGDALFHSVLHFEVLANRRFINIKKSSALSYVFF